MAVYRGRRHSYGGLAFLVMRSYALLRRQLWVLLVTIPLSIVSVGVTAVS